MTSIHRRLLAPGLLLSLLCGTCAAQETKPDAKPAETAAATQPAAQPAATAPVRDGSAPAPTTGQVVTAAPEVLNPPTFGPRGVRVAAKAGAEFAPGENAKVGAPDVPGWPFAKAGRALPSIADAEAAEIVKLLDGSFASEPLTGTPAGDLPALTLGMGRIDVTGLDNAVYFEIARADSVWKPFRQGILHAYRAKDGLRIRMYGLGGMPTLGEAVIGMWQVPEIFPDLDAANLVPMADLAVTKSGSTFKAKSNRFPIHAAGATEAEIELEIGSGTFNMIDRGFDAMGKQITGVAKEGENASIKFRTAPAKITSTRREDGLYIIDMVPPATGEIPVQSKVNMRVAAHYSGYIYNDGWKFSTSRDVRWDGTPAEPQLFNMQANLLSGWTKGMPGMTKGTMRRFIMPSGMAFHTSGNPQMRVPPNTPVIFELECMWVEDLTKVPPPAPPAPPAVKEEPKDGGKPADPAAGTGAAGGK